MRLLADWVTRRRTRVVAVVLLTTVVAMIGVLRLAIDDVPRNLFITDNDEFALLEEVYADFGSDDNDCILVVRSSDLFTPDAAAALRDLADRALRLTGVQLVQSMADALIFTDGRIPRSLLPAPGAPPDAEREAS